MIAAEMGLTKNMVIGRRHRLSMAGNSARGKMPTVTVAAQAAKVRPLIKPASIHPSLFPKKRSHKRKSPLAVAPSPVCDVSTHVDIMGLERGMCRYPFGDPSSVDFRYCGGVKASPSASYCKFHMKLCYTPRGLLQARKEGAYNVRRFGW
jgi:GcrA cell cycle regulator